MPEPYVFDRSSGALCLDFANTVGDRSGGRPTDRLPRYRDLVEWGRQAGVVEEREARRLLRASGRRPQEAERALRRAVALREAIYAAFSEVAAGRAPRREALRRLNEALTEALARLCVARVAGGFRWEWAGDEDDLLRVAWPVARSAAELLTSGAVDSVRECAAETCGWLFLDRSRNRSRRWCDMKVCGNRSKVRRYYQRARRAYGPSV